MTATRKPELSTGSTLSPDRSSVSDEEIRQLEAERADRLDPHHRWRNSEVDNTHRGWDSKRGDFRDNLEGHPPAWDTSDGAGRERDPEIWQRIDEETR